MKVIAHDRRLEGQVRTSRDVGVIEVSERTTLSYFTNRFSTLYEANGRAVITKLKIMAHGIVPLPCLPGTTATKRLICSRKTGKIVGLPVLTLPRKVLKLI